jgi:hypothetical protein
MERQNSHVVIGAALFLVLALAITLVYVSSQAEDNSNATTTVSITNTNPTVDTIVFSDTANGSENFSGGVTPVAGGTKTIHINGVVGDANGEADINATTMTFYRSGATNAEACTPDNNDCYRVDSCTLTSDTATTKKYDCEIAVQYYADSTDAGGQFSEQNWLTYVKVTDLSAGTGTSNTTAKEMNTTISLDIPSAINYGSFGLGASTTAENNQEMVITQKGNDEADVEVSGATMACSGIGSLPVGQQKWSANSDLGYNDAAGTLTGTPDDTNLNVVYRTDDANANTKTLYWNIAIPATGVKGVCTGTDTITTIAH